MLDYLRWLFDGYPDLFDVGVLLLLALLGAVALTFRLGDRLGSR